MKKEQKVILTYGGKTQEGTFTGNEKNGVFEIRTSARIHGLPAFVPTLLYLKQDSFEVVIESFKKLDKVKVLHDNDTGHVSAVRKDYKGNVIKVYVKFSFSKRSFMFFPSQIVHVY